MDSAFTISASASSSDRLPASESSNIALLHLPIVFCIVENFVLSTACNSCCLYWEMSWRPGESSPHLNGGAMNIPRIRHVHLICGIHTPLMRQMSAMYVPYVHHVRPTCGTRLTTYAPYTAPGRPHKPHARYAGDHISAICGPRVTT